MRLYKILWLLERDMTDLDIGPEDFEKPKRARTLYETIEFNKRLHPEEQEETYPELDCK